MSFTADCLLLFGATGDLAQRMLLPSLCALDADKLVAPDLRIVGTARQMLDDEGYRAFARAALEKFLPADRKPAIETFLQRLHYQPLDANETAHFADLAAKVGPIDQGLSIFLSTAPPCSGRLSRVLSPAALPEPRCGSASKSRSAPILAPAA